MTARLYVGTYAKYNSGSLQGAWMDLENYPDREAFLAAALALHADEHDPELMFQDFEGFPKTWYSESSAPPDALWDWLELSEDDRELLAVYQNEVNDSGGTPVTIDQAREAFIGQFDDEAHWAAQWLEDTGGLEGVPKHLENYIDFEAYGRDARLSGDIVFVRHGGSLWAFHANL
jgi:antirestriction protein